MHTNTILLIPLCLYFSVALSTKIIGLIPIRNEQTIIAQCLRGLALYTDAIIVLDDASEDNSLTIIKSITNECNIEKIIEKKRWYRDESHDRNLLLYHGRKLGGTHFIIIDADEMFTAPCLEQNFLREKILTLQPGDELALHWIELWGSIDYFNPNAIIKPFIFCDDGTCSYDYSFLHAPRVPQNLSGKLYTITSYTTHGLLHFKSVNLENLQIKKKWYQYLERIHNPTKSIEAINNFYAHYIRIPQKLSPSNPHWFSYNFFDPKIYHLPDTWKSQQINDWLQEHEQNYFQKID